MNYTWDWPLSFPTRRTTLPGILQFHQGIDLETGQEAWWWTRKWWCNFYWVVCFQTGRFTNRLSETGESLQILRSCMASRLRDNFWKGLLDLSSFVKTVLWSYQKMRKIWTSLSLSLIQPGFGPFPHCPRKREAAIRKWLSKSTKPPRSQWTVQRCRWCGPTQKAFVVFWMYMMASEAPKVHEKEVYMYNYMYIYEHIYTMIVYLHKQK